MVLNRRQGNKGKSSGSTGKKLSSFSKRQLQVESNNSQSGSESFDEDQCMPSLYSIRQSAKIQRKVDSRIRELE